MNRVTISHIFASALQERRTLGNFTVYWLLAAMTLGLPLIPFGLGSANASSLSLMIFGGMLYAIFMSILPQFIVSTLRLATPHFNRTVPGLTRSLKAAYGLLIFGSAALLALLSCLGGGEVGMLVLNFLLGFSLIAMSMLCASFFCMPGNVKYSLGAGALLVLLVATQGQAIRQALISLQSLSALVVLGLLIDAALFAVLAHWIFAVKGERAYRVAKKLQGFNAMMKGDMSRDSLMSWSKWLGTSWLYNTALTPAIAAANKPRLLLMGLGYGLHWSAVVSNVFWIVLFSVLYPLGFELLGEGGFVRSGLLHNPMLFFAFAMPIGVIRQCFQTLEQNRGEQQLLKLLPSSIQGRGYNRWLASAMLRQFGLCLPAALLLFGLVWIAMQLLGSDLANLDLSMLPVILVAMLPMALATLENYAASKGSYRHTWQYYVIAIILVVVLTIAAHSKTYPNLLWMECAIVISVTALLFIRRWRQTLRAPVALPTGRLAQ